MRWLTGTSELGAVVETVSVVEPPTAIIDGLKEQLLSLGRPAHVAEKLTCELNPFDPLTVSMVVADEPGELTFTMAGTKDTLKSGTGVTVNGIEGLFEPS